jgi:S-formylglutathione hydrolase FrmB
VYYLHGLFGDETNWMRQGRLPATMDTLVAAGMPELIVVTPDGDDGWYTTWNSLGDWATCRTAPPRETVERYCVPWPHYDDYVARDLVAHVDSTFRTLAQRAHRGIGGLSMGGYGAVSLALAYPDVFVAAASHSGVLSPLRLAGTAADAPASVAYAGGEAALARSWGRLWPQISRAFGRDTMAWWARDPGRLAERLLRVRPAAMPQLFIDVGREDGIVHQSRDLHRRLEALGVPHRYAEWPGGHDWPYWSRHLPESLRWLAGHVAPR